MTQNSSGSTRGKLKRRTSAAADTGGVLGGVGAKAGIDPAALVGSDTGVFVGACSQPYGASDSDSAEGYALTGLATSVAPGRIAYVLGLQGSAIKRRHRLLVIAGGHTPGMPIAAQRGISSRPGRRSHRNDHTKGVYRIRPPTRDWLLTGGAKHSPPPLTAPDGAKGAGVLVLERLSDARRTPPRFSVIAGSAINKTAPPTV